MFTIFCCPSWLCLWKVIGLPGNELSLVISWLAPLPGRRVHSSFVVDRSYSHGAGSNPVRAVSTFPYLSSFRNHFTTWYFFFGKLLLWSCLFSEVVLVFYPFFFHRLPFCGTSGRSPACYFDCWKCFVIFLLHARDAWLRQWLLDFGDFCLVARLTFVAEVCSSVRLFFQFRIICLTCWAVCSAEIRNCCLRGLSMSFVTTTTAADSIPWDVKIQTSCLS